MCNPFITSGAFVGTVGQSCDAGLLGPEHGRERAGRQRAATVELQDEHSS